MTRLRSRSSILAASALSIALASTAIAACSGKTTSSSSPPTPDPGGGDAGLGDSAKSDAAPSPRPSGCPATAPKSGAPCDREVTCEYGDDYNPLCNELYSCSGGSGATWGQPIVFAGDTQCPSKGPPSPPPNPSDCPTSRTAVPTGTCSSASTCSYEGSQCRCGAFCPSFPVGQPPCNPDAGVTQNCCDQSKKEWYCFDGPKFCPSPRPAIGSACTDEGEQCAVEAPVECGQARIECRNGKWQVANTSCPISSARYKKDISYVDDHEAERMRAELMNVRVATYRYKNGGDARHVGFIIEDMPEGSPAVMPSRERVDLYGYVSMTVASMQRQQREIDALKDEVRRLASENAKLRNSGR